MHEKTDKQILETKYNKAKNWRNLFGSLALVGVLSFGGKAYFENGRNPELHKRYELISVYENSLERIKEKTYAVNEDVNGIFFDIAEKVIGDQKEKLENTIGFDKYKKNKDFADYLLGFGCLTLLTGVLGVRFNLDKRRDLEKKLVQKK